MPASTPAMGPRSWTVPLGAMRITPSSDATSATVDQVRRLVGLLLDDGEVSLLAFDAGYDPVAIGHGHGGIRCEVLCQVRPRRPSCAATSRRGPANPFYFCEKFLVRGEWERTGVFEVIVTKALLAYDKTGASSQASIAHAYLMSRSAR